MSRKHYWWVGGIAAIVAALAVLLLGASLFDWNQARGWIAGQVKERTGRELEIGKLEVTRRFSLRPRIRAEQVAFSNAEWGERRPMFTADSVEFSISLPELLRGRVVLPEVTLGEAGLLLQRDSEDRRNWRLRPDTGDAGREPPAILQLAANRLTVRIKDEPSDTDLVVDTRPTADAGREIAFDAKGRVRGSRLAARGTGASLASLLDRSVPYRFKVSATVGEARATFDGTATILAAFEAIDARVTVAGRDLAVLADVLNLAWPPTASYDLAGRLRRSGKTWELIGISGTVGKSDVQGDLRVVRADPRPALTGKLVSRELDIADLGGFVGGRPGVADEKPAGKVLPAEQIDLAKLRRMDAKVSLTATSFRNRDKLPLDNLSATLVLADGVLRVEPLRFGVAGGSVDSRVAVDAREKAATVDIASSVRSLHINQLVPGTDVLDASLGAVDGKIALKGRGNSAAAVLGTSNGHIDLVSSGGEVSNLLLEIAGADLGEIVKFFVGGDQQVQLRCGVVAFDVQDGLMRSKAIVIDTDDTYIGGEGTVSLRDERLDLRLLPLPKDVSILSLRGPLRARGTFAEPSVGLEKRSFARKVGAALMLGLVNPVLALLPTVDTAPGKGQQAPCADLVAELESKVKPGKPKVVPEKRKKEIESEARDTRR